MKAILGPVGQGIVEAALFIAYSVAVAKTGPSIGENNEHRNWLGSTCTIGLFALGAIGLGIVLAGSREAGQHGFGFILGASWIGANFVLTGSFVALLPAITSSWADPASDE